MVRIGEKAARGHSDLIRPATELLYLASGSECRGGCEYITGLSPARRRQLLLRLIGGFLLLLLRLFGPRRHNSVRARVGDGLPQMLAKVPGDHDERAAQGGLTAEHFLRLVRVRVVERNDSPAEMC